ncbi:hypothetical protein LBMAG18_03780 [Alphaproteobacteria bacterium]|nr:hypothetical protein LBMAG18_03780 [Alphaproteobacteria bacterium]
MLSGSSGTFKPEIKMTDELLAWLICSLNSGYLFNNPSKNSWWDSICSDEVGLNFLINDIELNWLLILSTIILTNSLLNWGGVSILRTYGELFGGQEEIFLAK